MTCPVSRYEREITRSLANEAAQDKPELSETLRREISSQEQINARCAAIFTVHASSWLATPDASEWCGSFLQHCLLPRILATPNDASYAAAFIRALHRAAPSDLPLYELSSQLSGELLTSVIFTCTEREAGNLGRFLAEWLTYLAHLGEGDEIGPLALSVRKPGGIGEDSGSLSRTQYLEAWYGWHRSLWRAIKACYDSKEYVHIRNCLFVLERLSKVFPHFAWMGKNIMTSNSKVASAETREDLRIRALGYSAMLKRLEPAWVEPPLQKSTGAAVVASKEVESRSPDRPVERKEINASADSANAQGPSSKDPVGRSSDDPSKDRTNLKLPRGPSSRNLSSEARLRNQGEGHQHEGKTVQGSEITEERPRKVDLPTSRSESTPRRTGPARSTANAEVSRSKGGTRDDRPPPRGDRSDLADSRNATATATNPSDRHRVEGGSTAHQEEYGRLRRAEANRSHRNVSEEMRSDARGPERDRREAAEAGRSERPRIAAPQDSRGDSDRRRPVVDRPGRDQPRSPTRKHGTNDEQAAQARNGPELSERVKRQDRGTVPRGPSGPSNGGDSVTRPRGPSNHALTGSSQAERDRASNDTGRLRANGRGVPQAPRDQPLRSMARTSESRGQPQAPRSRAASPQRLSPKRGLASRDSPSRVIRADPASGQDRRRGGPRDRSPQLPPPPRSARLQPMDGSEARTKRRRH